MYTTNGVTNTNVVSRYIVLELRLLKKAETHNNIEYFVNFCQM